MKKFLPVLVCFILILIFNSSVLAANESDEIIFKKFYNCINNKQTASDPVIIDYSVEILKNKPNSYDALYVLSLFIRIDVKDKIKDKYKELRNKYYSSLNDANSNIPEKIVLLMLMVARADTDTIEEINENINTFNNSLIYIRDNCRDKNFSALAAFTLFYDSPHRKSHIDFFMKNFPNHQALPLVELIFITELFNQKNYQTCVDECKKYIEKYKDIVTPFGWKLKMDAVNLIIDAYIALKDHANANAMFELMKNEAPNYDNIKDIERSLSRLKK